MLVVVVDTSTPAVTAAVARISDGGLVEVLAERVTVDARAHSEVLAPQLDAVLTAAGVSVRDLDAVVVGLGPGPFTGLRVGMVTAATIGQARGIPTYGVTSLDGIGAHPAKVDAQIGPVLVATDARRKEIYWAVYLDGARITEPAVNRPADVVDLLKTLPALPTAAVGDGALKYADVLGLPILPEPQYPQATTLAALAADRILAKAPSEHLTPLYLRRPDATEPHARKPVTA